MKRKIRDIMNEMDELEKVEISDEFIEKMREIYKDKIEDDEYKDNERVARGINSVVHNGKVNCSCPHKNGQSRYSRFIGRGQFLGRGQVARGIACSFTSKV